MSVRFDFSQALSYSIDLRSASFELASEASRAIRKTALEIERDAKHFCPVDTGFLQNSISTSFRGSGRNLVAEIGPTASYGAFVEYGTSRTPPQPYMRPATDRHTPGLYRVLEDISRRVL